MPELNRENIIKALEYCTSPNKNANCSLECPYGDINLCEQLLMFHSLNLVKTQEQKIFELENRLKECENGYEGTLFLDRCKLQDAEEKVKQLTEENERLKADVVPRSEVEKLKKIYRTYNKAIKYERQEIAKQIFEGIEERLKRLADESKILRDKEINLGEKTQLNGEWIGVRLALRDIAEIKKKYIGENNG